MRRHGSDQTVTRDRCLFGRSHSIVRVRTRRQWRVKGHPLRVCRTTTATTEPLHRRRSLSATVASVSVCFRIVVLVGPVLARRSAHRSLSVDAVSSESAVLDGILVVIRSLILRPAVSSSSCAPFRLPARCLLLGVIGARLVCPVTPICRSSPCVVTSRSPVPAIDGVVSLGRRVLAFGAGDCRDRCRPDEDAPSDPGRDQRSRHRESGCWGLRL